MVPFRLAPLIDIDICMEIRCFIISCDVLAKTLVWSRAIHSAAAADEIELEGLTSFEPLKKVSHNWSIMILFFISSEKSTG